MEATHYWDFAIASPIHGIELREMPPRNDGLIRYGSAKRLPSCCAAIT